MLILFAISSCSMDPLPGSARKGVLQAPGGIKAVSSDGQLALSWNSQAGAHAYVLYSVDSLGGILKTVDPHGVSYVDTGLTNGNTYSYYISAVGDAGESPLSALFQAVPGAPSTPTAAAGNQQVTLSWKPTQGATKYNVNMSAYPLDSAYPNYPVVTNSGSYASASGGSNSIVLNGLNNGTTYYFVISAVYANSELVSQQAQARPLPPPPATPTGLTAVAGDKQVTLSWSPVAGVKVYGVYWSSAMGIVTSPLPWLTPSGGNLGVSTGNTTFTVTGLVNGNTAGFIVVAYDQYGSMSAPTDQVLALPSAP
jgi:hypothetical protein